MTGRFKIECEDILGHIDRPNTSAASKVQYPRGVGAVHWNRGIMQSASPGNLHYLVVDVHAVFLVLNKKKIFFVSRPSLPGRTVRSVCVIGQHTSSHGYMYIPFR